MSKEHEPNAPLLITVKEAANRLSLSTRTLHREISAGRFPRPVKIGRASRIPIAALVDYVRSLSEGVRT